jgi:hypothetical protein
MDESKRVHLVKLGFAGMLVLSLLWLLYLIMGVMTETVFCEPFLYRISSPFLIVSPLLLGALAGLYALTEQRRDKRVLMVFIILVVLGLVFSIFGWLHYTGCMPPTMEERRRGMEYECKYDYGCKEDLDCYNKDSCKWLIDYRYITGVECDLKTIHEGGLIVVGDCVLIGSTPHEATPSEKFLCQFEECADDSDCLVEVCRWLDVHCGEGGRCKFS